MHLLRKGRAFVLRHPLVFFWIVTIGLAESLIWLSALLPPEYHQVLPWIIRGMAVAGSSVGLILIRAACYQAVHRSADRITGKARAARAGRAPGRPEGAGGYGHSRPTSDQFPLGTD